MDSSVLKPINDGFGGDILVKVSGINSKKSPSMRGLNIKISKSFRTSSFK